ncbi:MAG: hypothetical protein SFV22_18605 [Saprospiraceae bacterium]|nr:hypothetical protein [Saprospiraceae bacterium]
MSFPRLLLFLAGFCFHHPSGAQSSVVWSDSTQVVATPLPVTAPRVRLLPDGTPLVFWGTSSANSQIWCARYENGAFTTPVAVVAPPQEPSLFGFGGFDVALSDTRIYLVFEQLQQGIWLTWSDDGGLTFEAPVEVQGPISGGYITIASVVSDGTGNPVVSYIREKNGAVYEVRRSTDGGASFGEPVVANAPSPGGMVCECCTSDLLASGDSVWIIYRNNNQNLRDIWVSRSTDLAQSFDVAVDVDETDWLVNVCPISGPQLARSGDSIFTVWMSQADGMAKVYASSLHAGAMQFGQQIGFPSQSMPPSAQTFPEIAALGDTVGIIMVEKAKELVFYHSIKGLQLLNSTAQRLAVPSHTLQFPSLAYQNGIFHLVYADATSDQVLYRRGVLTTSSRVAEVEESGIALFPNPVQEGIFSVRSRYAPIREIQLLDMFGKTVFNQEASGYEAFCRPARQLKGTFILKVNTAKESWGEIIVFH